jgi:hypothetical protein
LIRAIALIFEWSNGLRISPYSRKQASNILHFGYALQILVVVPTRSDRRIDSGNRWPTNWSAESPLPP